MAYNQVCQEKETVGTIQLWRVGSRTLKDECVREKMYASHDEARLALFIYIETYYNRVRRHSTLGYVSPLQYEKMEKYYTLQNV